MMKMKQGTLALSLAFACLPALGPASLAWAEAPKAALLYTDMKGVEEENKAAMWGYTKTVFAEFYSVLPDERVLPVHEKAKTAGCEGVACLEAVRKDLGVPVALQLRHVSEGYFQHLYVTRVTDEGAREKSYWCSRCTPQEFQVILKRLMRTFDEPQH
jgi:hypothetical protein